MKITYIKISDSVRIRVQNDTARGIIQYNMQHFFFGKWRMVTDYQECVEYYNVT